MYNATKQPGEVETQFGDYTYTPLAQVRFTATICDDTETMYRPSIYKITNYQPQDSQSELDLEQIPRQVTSNIGLYRNVARNGQQIKVAGTLKKPKTSMTAPFSTRLWWEQQLRKKNTYGLYYKLRDRDAIQTAEGLIFSGLRLRPSPKRRYVCDAEYASAKISRSPPTHGHQENRQKRIFYKFYNDEGMNSSKSTPIPLIPRNASGGKNGRRTPNLRCEARQPQCRLQALLRADPFDPFVAAMERVLGIVTKVGVGNRAFGVFGSMLHGFSHPKYSDIDFTIYGKTENAQMRQTLQTLYSNTN